MQRARLIPILLVLCVTLVFGRVCVNEFTWWDDNTTIHQNERISKPSVENALWYWGHAEYGIYIPLTYTAWSALAMVGGLDQPDANGISLNPWIFHGGSLLAHLVTVLAVYAILRKLIRRDWPAFAGALLFGIPPLQVEAVAWASGLKDVLCGMFGMLAIWQWILFRKRDRQDARGTKHYSLAICFFIFSMLSKPAGMMLPVAVGVIDLVILRVGFSRSIKSLGPWFVLAGACAVLARINQPGVGIANVGVWSRPLIVGDSILFYLFKFIFPFALGLDYGREPTVVIRNSLIYFEWMIPVALGIFIWTQRKKRPIVAAAGLLFIIPILPVLGFVTFLFQYYSTTADHYLYQAMLGPALGLSWLLKEFPNRGWVTAVSTWLTLLGLLAVQQAGYWHSDQEIWAHVLEVNSKSFTAHNLLGEDLARLDKLDEAAAHFKTAASLNPDDPRAFENLGKYYALKHQWNEAIDALAKRLEILSKRPIEVRGDLTEMYNQLRLARANLATSRPTSRKGNE